MGKINKFTPHKFIGNIELKHCSRCDCWFILDLFGKSKSTKDLLLCICRKCSAEISRNYYIKNTQKIKEKVKKYTEENPNIRLKASRKYYKNNKNELNRRAREYKKCNPEKIKERSRKNYIKNKEKITERNKKWVENNRDKVRASARKSAKKNAARVNAFNSKRRADKLNATPKWLTDEQISSMQSVYKESHRLTKETGIKYHVDHIVPLRGKTVCGLHVPWNLRIVKAEENLHKLNKLIDVEIRDTFDDSIIEIIKLTTEKYEKIIDSSKHRFIGEVEFKYCKRCNQWKVIDLFSKDKTNTDGYRFYCKECVSEYMKKAKENKVINKTEEIIDNNLSY